jgi:hypothetical protein
MCLGFITFIVFNNCYRMPRAKQDNGGARPKTVPVTKKACKPAWCRKCEVMHPPPCGRNCKIQQVVEESDTSMEEVLPVPEVDHIPPLLAATDQSLVGEFRNMATVMSSIVTRLDRQQTQLNALQGCMLSADLSGAKRFPGVAVGVEAITPPPAHPSQHEVIRGAEAIAPPSQPDVSGAIL